MFSYNLFRQRPTLNRNQPPVAGRIRWARLLYSRIKNYMDVFKSRAEIIGVPQGQRCVTMYNSLCSVFAQFEEIYHDGWYEYCDQVEHCLAQPILLKHPRSNRYIVNYDNFITEVIRESNYMFRLDLGELHFFRITPNICQFFCA